jgi:hypothetical protein
VVLTCKSRDPANQSTSHLKITFALPHVLFETHTGTQIKRQTNVDRMPSLHTPFHSLHSAFQYSQATTTTATAIHLIRLNSTSATTEAPGAGCSWFNSRGLFPLASFRNKCGWVVGAGFAFFNTLQSHPAVVLFVYLYTDQGPSLSKRHSSDQRFRARTLSSQPTNMALRKSQTFGACLVSEPPAAS